MNIQLTDLSQDLQLMLRTQMEVSYCLGSIGCRVTPILTSILEIQVERQIEKSRKKFVVKGLFKTF